MSLRCLRTNVSNQEVYFKCLTQTRWKSVFKGKKQKTAENVVYQDLNLPAADTQEFEKDEFLPRRLTYFPPGLKFGLPKKRYKKINERLTLYPQIDTRPEWTETPQYPPLCDDRDMKEGEFKRKRLEWYEEIKALPTVEAKLFEIIREHRLKCLKLTNWAPLYDYLQLYQFATKTHVIRTTDLPSSADEQALRAIVDKLRGPILDAVRNHFESEMKLKTEFRAEMVGDEHRLNVTKTNSLVQDIALICQRQLCANYDHLLDAHVDMNADVRSWWWCHMNVARQSSFHKDKGITSVDQPIQYRVEVPVQFRTDKPLPNLTDFNGPLSARDDFPVAEKHLKKDGFKSGFKFLQMMPGFWSLTERKYDFPFLSFFSRYPLEMREKAVGGRSYPDEREFLEGMAVMHNFAWCNAISAFHGFTPYQEITYPFVSQTVITDGQRWSFYKYQMNTHSFHSDITGPAAKQNICWSTDEKKLFEEYRDGEFKGVNDDVLEALVRLLIEKPVAPAESIALRPYLSADTREEEAVQETRKNLRGRYGQQMASKLRAKTILAKNFPYDYAFVRNPDTESTVHWRLPHKPKWGWPREKFTYF